VYNNLICGNSITDASDADTNSWLSNTCDSGAPYCSATCAGDNCAYGGSGDMTYLAEDNCVISSAVTITGKCYLKGAVGSLTIASGGDLKCQGSFNFEPTALSRSVVFARLIGSKFAVLK
jgi:hypothetical protein